MKEKHWLYRNYIKRILDIIGAILVLLLFWWVYAIVALLVLINLGSPVLYKSERMGRDEKPFRCYKFRSMTNETDENGVLLQGSQRLTKFGRILRSTSLDELPSIINILKGDLSFVGPRPLLMKYQPYYYSHERVRHTVRPGLTGWAQANGRNRISWDDKFKLDIEYVENMSFLFDLKVLFVTVVKVVKRSDIIQDNQKARSLNVVRADMVKQDDEANTNGGTGCE